MHFKYAGIMNIVYVTLMYGFGMPVLYPIAVYALVVLYLSEKAMLYYSYRQPPTYDQRLSNYVIVSMMMGPCLMLFFGYWMLSSKQLISNGHLQPRDFGNDPELSEHVWREVFQKEGWTGPAWPVLLCAFIVLFMVLFHKPLNKLWNKIFSCWVVGDVDPNEEIDKYWKSLDTHDLGWSYCEEMKARELFKPFGLDFNLLTDESFSVLEEEYKNRNIKDELNKELVKKGKPGIQVEAKRTI